jgi:predicted O-methyltransferase YrrM
MAELVSFVPARLSVAVTGTPGDIDSRTMVPVIRTPFTKGGLYVTGSLGEARTRGVTPGNGGSLTRTRSLEETPFTRLASALLGLRCLRRWAPRAHARRVHVQNVGVEHGLPARFQRMQICSQQAPRRERVTLSPLDLTRGLLRPSSLDDCLDPFRVKEFSRLNPCRLLWTLQSRALQWSARLAHRPFFDIAGPNAEHMRSDRGDSLDNTAVTTSQLELLMLAVAIIEDVSGDVVEIGSYRGATTVRLAASTSKTIHAVDPFVGYGGSEEDLQIFRSATANCANVNHIRQSSGSAAERFSDPIALLFVDAIHDFSNSWFDFCAWSPKVVAGGFVAMHDVDDFPGVGMTCRLIDALPDYSTWAYAPNIAIFRKPSKDESSAAVVEQGRGMGRTAREPEKYPFAPAGNRPEPREPPADRFFYSRPGDRPLR